jgi:flagellar hook protein FlgE
MLDSIYIGLTGLTGFSDGLKNISNNVANVNTPGFKGTQLQFEDLFYRLQSGAGSTADQPDLFMGSGMKTGGSTVLFKQGDVKSTGNDLDAALDGNGFFVLRRDDGKLTFTRNGEFSLDANGFLVVRGGTERVQGLDGHGGFTDINIRDLNVSPAKATTTIKLTGNLSVDDSDNTQTVSNIPVFDAHGGNSPLKVTFTKDTSASAVPRSWKIRIEDTAGNLVDDTGEIRFNGDGSPQPGFETHGFTFTPVGADPMTLTLDFGTAGGFSGATNFSAGPDSSLALGSQDGLASGALTKATFDADGRLALTYSNGQTASHGQLALAWFDFLQGLEPSGQSGFENNTGLAMRVGAPRTSLFGGIKPGSIESSNVDLSQQFTDLIVIQRGFQGSSQVVTVANEMIQQLLDIQGGGSRG